MAIAITVVNVQNSGVDATSFTGSFTADAATLYVALIEASRATNNPPDPTVTHNSITATKIASLLWITSGAERRQIWVYAWDSLAGGGSTATVDFGVTMSGCSQTYLKVTGTDMANGVVQTFVQNVATGADLSGTSGSITLAAAGNAANRPLKYFCHQANEESTVEAGWTALTNAAHNNPSTGAKPGWHSSTFDTSVVMTWTTSSPYGGLAVEIKDASAGGGGAQALDPFGMMGFFGA